MMYSVFDVEGRGQIKGLFDYRIQIRIHCESRFSFTWQIE